MLHRYLELLVNLEILEILVNQCYLCYLLHLELLVNLVNLEGYFMKWEEDAQLRFLKRYAYCGFSLSFILEAVPRLIKWGLFDKIVFDSFHVLTSARIQSTWIDATRKRSSRDIISDYWVIDGVKAEETPKKAEATTQRKVKESKVKEVEEPPPPLS